MLRFMVLCIILKCLINGYQILILLTQILLIQLCFKLLHFGFHIVYSQFMISPYHYIIELQLGI